MILHAARGLALGLGLVLAADASWAQSSVFMGGSATRPQIRNVPIDTSRSVVGPTSLGTFNLNRMFRRIRIRGGDPVIGQSPLPPPSAFRSTHYKNGLNPFVTSR
ncbi:MAG: hypothetical protein NZ700_08125 [Gemmataceae bacterium]|nr:hypothetical protein [Gemmataceae bacterium]MDW8264372.1 hypothetical protein [Gemmataceae bacterium]